MVLSYGGISINGNQMFFGTIDVFFLIQGPVMVSRLRKLSAIVSGLVKVRSLDF